MEEPKTEVSALPIEDSKAEIKPSLIEKFKSLKKPYQIGIIAGVVVLCLIIIISIANSTSNETPFDKVSQAMGESSLKDDQLQLIINFYDWPENEEDIGKTSLSYSYPWVGCNDGKLTIFFKAGYLDGWYINHAFWYANTDNPDQTVKRIKKIMDKKYGDSEFDKQSVTYKWYDKYGKEITLSPNYRHNTVDMYYG